MESNMINIEEFFDENWSKIDDNAKIKLLEELEKLMAQVQQRTAREIVQTADNKYCMAGVNAQYNFGMPNQIYVRKTDSGFESALSIIHEGIHAMYDDAFNGKIEAAHSFENVNAKKLTGYRKNRSIIHNHFKNNQNPKLGLLFDLCYIEEHIAHRDSKLYLIELIGTYVKNKLKDFQSKSSCKEKLYNFYKHIFERESDRLLYLKNAETDSKTNYDLELTKIDYKVFEDKKEECKQPKIVIYNSSVSGHFFEQLQLVQNMGKTNLMGRKKEYIDKFANNFVAYFSSFDFAVFDDSRQN